MRRRVMLEQKKRYLDVKPEETLWIDVGDPGMWQVRANVKWKVR